MPKPTPKAAEEPPKAEPPQAVVEPVVEPVAEPEPQLSTESEPIALQEENQPEQVLLGQHGSLEMDFDIRRNGDKGTAGNTHISYTQEDDGSYVLKSLSEARGFAALFFSGLVQTSAGVVTNKGLKPATFTYQYGDNVDKSRHATFDWQTAKITLQNKSGTDTVDLPAGTQDMLSFMYQFRFVPPLNEMSLSVTNGRKVRVYEYGFEGEDTVQTKLGALRSLHISRHGDEGEQKAELWLAIDYQFLPVKIRITEKDGNVIEQIVTRIASSGADNTLPKP